MRKSSRVLPCLAVVMIIVGLAACAGISGQTDISPTPTEVLVIPLNQPGRVNADVVPVRSGPGVEYEQVGALSRNRGLTVVGQSGDGKWYKVQLLDYSGDQPSFWVAADFVTLIFSTETVTMTVVVSVPSFTLFETTTTQALSPSLSVTVQTPISACKAPTGWVPYIVQPPDTLSRLAIKTNTTVDQIMRANCLISNQIVAGSRLYLPFVPPTDTLLPIQSPTSTTTASVIQTPTSTTTGTPSLIQTPTITATACPTPQPTDTVTSTASMTPHAIDTVTNTNTAIVSQVAPTLGTSSP